MHSVKEPSTEQSLEMNSLKLAETAKRIAKRFYISAIPMMTTVSLTIIDWKDVIDVWEGPGTD